MMDWFLKGMRKKMRASNGWQIALAAFVLFTFIAVGSAGAGIPEPAKDGVIGGRAWCDVNEDGKRQKGEPLLPDVEVTLKKLEHDGTWTDVKTKTTNAKGRYKFKKLPLGTYVVVFEDKGLTFTKADIGKDKRDSDVTETLKGAGCTDHITLDAYDPTNYSTDAGYLGCDTPQPPKNGAIGGVTWCDENHDGKRQANEILLPGVCVTLIKIVNGQEEVVATASTDAQGRYKFENLPRGTYVVKWCDNDLSFTLANKGDDCKDSDVVDHSGGKGRSDQIVLNDDNTTSLCTDAGYVGDCGPPPPPEAMCAVVASTGTTFEFTYENIPADSAVLRNGEAIDTIGGTGTFSDSPGGPDGTEYEYAIDADGEIIAVCGTVTVVNPPQPDEGLIKGKAWCDVNEDGKRQDTDTHLPDVAVTLKKQLPDGALEVVDTTTTDADGRYQFTDLPFGTYVVAFDDNGLEFTTPDAADDCRDSDVVEQYDGTGFTAPIVLDAHEPTSTCTDAGYVGCAEKECLKYNVGYPVKFEHRTNIKRVQAYIWITLEQLKNFGIDVTGYSDNYWTDDFTMVAGDVSEIEAYLSETGVTNIQANVARGKAGPYLFITADAPRLFSYLELQRHLPKELYFTVFLIRHGKKQEICIRVHDLIATYFTASPIGLDVDGSGAVERIGGEFEFDFAANGEPVKAAEWFAPTEGILVNTRIAGPMTGAHLFGDMGGQYADGYAKLATLDANGDGAVSGAELTGLAIWTDANSNAMADDGEISSLTAHRIVSLSTSHTGYLSTVTLADGSTMLAEDLWFPVVPVPPMAQPVAAPVPVKALALGLGGALLLVLLIVAARRWRQVSAPEAA